MLLGFFSLSICFILFGLSEFCLFGLSVLTAVTHVFHSYCQISGPNTAIITLGPVSAALT